MINLLNKSFIIYVIKFLFIFCFLYFGTIAVIGLCTPSGYYSSFIAHYFNFIDWLRFSLLCASKALLSTIGFTAYIVDKFTLRINNQVGIKMVYSCVGYGVMSFWGALILANKGVTIKKIKWLIGGWLAIWSINILRITLLLIALYNSWQIPFGLDHHTWFNIVAYILIFVLIYFYDRSTLSNSSHISKSFK